MVVVFSEENAREYLHEDDDGDETRCTENFPHSLHSLRANACFRPWGALLAAQKFLGVQPSTPENRDVEIGLFENFLGFRIGAAAAPTARHHTIYLSTRENGTLG